MNVLLLGAEHQVAQELSGLLDQSRISYQQIALPSLENPLSDELISELEMVQSDSVVFTPQIPLSRLSFRRRLHLVDMVKTICGAISRNNIPFLHLSSSSVYDGRAKQAYCELDKPSPASDMAKVWHRWETIVRKQFQKHIIIRPGWLLGRERAYLSSEVKQALGDHTAPDLVTQATGSPVAPEEVARVVFAILRQLETGARNYGVFHVASKDVMSSARILERIAPDSYLNIDAQSKVLNYELDCQKILRSFGIQQRSW